MSFQLKAKIEGLDELVKQLRDELPKRMQNKILRKAIGEGSKLILKTAKAKVVKDTGMLKRSLGRKIVAKRSTGAVVAIIGPRTGYKKVKVKGTKTFKRERTKLGEKFAEAGVSPVRYAHLVEKGTRHSAPKPFLRPALDTNMAAIRQIFERTIRDGLEKNRIGAVEADGVKSD